VTLVREGPLFIVFAAVSASMQQLLAVMHGPSTTGIVPPKKVRRSPISFSFCSFFVVPEGDFRLGAEFNAAVTEASKGTISAKINTKELRPVKILHAHM